MSYTPATVVGAKAFFDLCFYNKTGLTFQDVLLEPQYSEIDTRADINLDTYITPLRKLHNPIIAANMDTITEYPMASAMRGLGGNGVIHRYMSYEKQLLEVSKLGFDSNSNLPIITSVGVRNGVVNQVKELVSVGASIIVIDVAHGHHKLVGDLLQELKKLELVCTWDNLPVEFIAGNVSTPEGVRFLFEAGADAVKVGIGAGSICSTRTVTGHGTPQMLAIASSALAAYEYKKPIIADGGFKTSGDIVKALAVGANTIMTGYLLAGTDECPIQQLYRGMASDAAQKEYYGNSPDAPEGVSRTISSKGPVAKVMTNLLGSIRSGLSYSGVNSISELQTKASFLKISNATYLESLTI